MSAATANKVQTQSKVQCMLALHLKIKIYYLYTQVHNNTISNIWRYACAYVKQF